jgi:hypothetical protein
MAPPHAARPHNTMLLGSGTAAAGMVMVSLLQIDIPRLRCPRGAHFRCGVSVTDRLGLGRGSDAGNHRDTQQKFDSAHHLVLLVA